MHEGIESSYPLTGDDYPPFAPGQTLTLRSIADDLAVALHALEGGRHFMAAGTLAVAIGNLREVADDVFVTGMDASTELGLQAAQFATDGLHIEAADMRRHAISMRELARRSSLAEVAE
jgi:hypothetical protein